MKKTLNMFICFFALTFVLSAQTTKNLHYYENTILIPDGDGNSLELYMDIEGYTPGQVICSANDICSFCINIEHSNLNDLEIKIRCPNGQEMTLVEYNSGIAFLGEPIIEGHDPGNGYEYCWTPSTENGTFSEASTTYTTIPANDYYPNEPFEFLIGCMLNWDWYFIITDNNSLENGHLFSWSIDFCEQFTETSNMSLSNDTHNTNVYPNPCTDIINFDLDVNNYRIELFNIDGQKIRFVNSNNKSKTSISTVGLNDGMYFYTITSDCEMTTAGKLIIKK